MGSTNCCLRWSGFGRNIPDKFYLTTTVGLAFEALVAPIALLWATSESARISTLVALILFHISTGVLVGMCFILNFPVYMAALCTPNSSQGVSPKPAFLTLVSSHARVVPRATEAWMLASPWPHWRC